ncbi:ribosome maturation factor RimM [Polluticaenibacter yanchengensis]|uniref:Ribosome maturation factor RimM n=1 Tax=Polluticaenibacter yanchengensis TaxID=3014562 RepID=A0ABT4UJC8_9BACT|nr:ribosome maturation factor RimM [Chitinophagaceae bacterium LY-5]
MDNITSVGKIVATFGIKGELIISHGLNNKSDFKGLKVLIIEEKADIYVPYFVESIKAKNADEFAVKLEGINTKEQAQAMLKKNIWMKNEDFNKFVSTQSSLALIGFSVVENGKALGDVVEVIEQPHQILCTIIMEGKEVYIPLHEQSLKGVDRAKKKIMVSLPEGLLDIYLK